MKKKQIDSRVKTINNLKVKSLSNVNLVRNSKKVLVFGTYDILHPGHVAHLKKASKHGVLYVVVGLDKTVKDNKKREPYNDENTRLAAIKKIDCVYDARLGDVVDKYKCIEDIRPDLICLGYDQTYFIDNLSKELKKRNLKTKIIRFRKGHLPHIYKSSKLREKMSQR
ncbi:MAG: adenylyltransferase/cytidyltransferase family protein [Candidatus Woesearchaeota archaeon]|jgi:FAD synthetase